MVPGVEIVDLGQPAVGLAANALNALPEYKRTLQRAELEAVAVARLDALAAIYHVDHRELCAHERDCPFRIINILELIGESMGLHHADHFKRLKIMQDEPPRVLRRPFRLRHAAMAGCRDLTAAHGLDLAAARPVLTNATLAEQPLPLGRTT